MKLVIVFIAILAVSATQAPDTNFRNLNRVPRPTTTKPYSSNRVASRDQAANVLLYNNKVNPDGSYKYNFFIDNGISAQAQGTPREFGGNPPVVPVVSQGSFSWKSPEGQYFKVKYVADERGYRPSVYAFQTLLADHHLPPSDVGKSISNALKKKV